MKTHTARICIVGGGLAGRTLALALASQKFDVVLVERDSTAKPDDRVTSLNVSTTAMFTNIGLWPALGAHAQPMTDIKVVDGDGGPAIAFAALEGFGARHGDVVHNQVILGALDKALAKSPYVTVVPGASAALGDASPAAQSILLSNGDRVDAALICAADGARSCLRTQMNIEVDTKSYGQANITATLAHENPHGCAGFQRFMPGGPVAFIPMQGNQSSLAWTLPTVQAKAVMALDDAAFMALLSDQIFGTDGADARGPFTRVGPRSTYPLYALVAQRFHAARLVLVGDAAHAIHPLAGQGFNLTARDVAGLVDVLKEARAAGEDIGSPRWTKAYTHQRRADILALYAATDGLNRLFSTTAPGRSLFRKSLIKAGQRAPKIGGSFTKQAQGSLLGLPSLMREAG